MKADVGGLIQIAWTIWERNDHVGMMLAAAMGVLDQISRSRGGRRHAGADLARFCQAVGWAVATPAMRSGRKRQGAQSRQGGAELVLPGPALGKMQGEPAGLAGEASGDGEEASSEGLGGGHRLAQGDATGPAGQVVSDDLHRQPGGIGGEASRGEMVEPHAVLEVADGVLDLGVAAMVGLQIQGVAVSVGDEGVIAVIGKEGQLRAGSGFDPPGR